MGESIGRAGRGRPPDRDRRSGLEKEIASVERELVRVRQYLADLRRCLPAVEVEDHVLTGPGDSDIRLSSLFGGKDDLLVIHNMGRICPMCTLWADGFNGVLAHLESRTAFVVVSPDPPEEQAEFARERSWRFRMLSAKGSGFNRDLGFETADGHPMPGASAFEKTADGTILRVARADFHGEDEYCSVFHLFDLLRDGAAAWRPALSYEDAVVTPGG